MPSGQGCAGRMSVRQRATYAKPLWGGIGIMEKKMETTIVYWDDIGGYMGIMEKNTNYLEGLCT